MAREPINLSFTEPRFLGQNLAAGFDVYHSISDLGDTLGYEKQETGGKLRLSMPLNDEMRLSTYYRFARREITCLLMLGEGCSPVAE